MEPGLTSVRIGLLVTGDTSVRAAHSLAAHPGIDEVVVIAPANSKSFEVVPDATDCDLLIGSGPSAPAMARRHQVPLIWDGVAPDQGVAVWGASPTGLAIALGTRETDPRLVAVAHPGIPGDTFDNTNRFPDPVGRVGVSHTRLGDMPVAQGRSPNEYAACLVVGGSRRVTVVDQAAFLAGIALAAGVVAANGQPCPVWDAALPYLETAMEMGLVMAESES
ncbi:MAG TPA: hypothetical protein VFP42_08090 [Acidimicrobiia bacterium]|nr:hypothetical protein [Acidimicrobiia bacterium]